MMDRRKKKKRWNVSLTCSFLLSSHRFRWWEAVHYYKVVASLFSWSRPRGEHQQQASPSSLWVETWTVSTSPPTSRCLCRLLWSGGGLGMFRLICSEIWPCSGAPRSQSLPRARESLSVRPRRRLTDEWPPNANIGRSWSFSCKRWRRGFSAGALVSQSSLTSPWSFF